MEKLDSEYLKILSKGKSNKNLILIIHSAINKKDIFIPTVRLSLKKIEFNWIILN